jgi:hypothetical protein
MKKLNEKIYINKAITDFMQLMFFLMNFVQSMEYVPDFDVAVCNVEFTQIFFNQN